MDIYDDDQPSSPINNLNKLYLYYHPSHYLSHFVLWGLLEKQIEHEPVSIDPELRPEFLADLNPYATLPVLADRQIKLYHTESMIEYLEERYRQVQLWPTGVNQRAELRQLFWRIKTDWMLKGTLLLDGLVATEQETVIRAELKDALIELSPLFKQSPWFLSNSLSYCDLMLGVFLSRLDAMKISLPPAHTAALREYMRRLFQRPAFQSSLQHCSLS